MTLQYTVQPACRALTDRQAFLLVIETRAQEQSQAEGARDLVGSKEIADGILH